VLQPHLDAAVHSHRHRRLRHRRRRRRAAVRVHSPDRALGPHRDPRTRPLRAGARRHRVRQRACVRLDLPLQRRGQRRHRVGAGAVVSPGSSLEERWIFARAGTPGKAAGDLVLTGSQAGMAARDAAGSPVRAALFGPGSIADQSGGRMLLSTQSASAIEAKLAGATLSVTGNPVRDFQAYAPGASAVTLNGVSVSATFAGGLVTYPGVIAPPPPPGDAGTPDAGALDAGGADGGPADSGHPGDLCGNCQPASDGGANPPLDAGTMSPAPALTDT